MEKTNKQQGERLSFYELFAVRNYKIVIPIIQREYAQGRITSKVNEVRRNFLDALFEYLDKRQQRDLDFVYGKIQKSEDDNTIRFEPLDGQQRLTTLFLLHWYLYQISDKETLKAEFKRHLLKDGTSQFTYETRPSSTSFCDELMKCEIDMNYLVLDSDKKPSLSRTIRNKQWYFLSWDDDPTIQSMLVMLDAIHEKFKGKSEFFPLLLNLENPIITFLFMDLEKCNLSDDLYIKMNSRGKPLTTFENLKANLEQYLDKVKAQDDFELVYDNQPKKVSVREYFAYNMDTKWTDFFWTFRNANDELKKEPFDSLLEHLIRVLLTGHYASSNDISQKSKDDGLNSLLYDDDSRFTFSHYQELNAITSDSLLYVIKSLDALSGLGSALSNALAKDYTHYFNVKDVLYNALQNKIDSRADRMNLFAFIGYLIRFGKTDGGINEWMRVVSNLTYPENTITNTPEEFAAGIKSINNLLPNANDILNWLTKNYNIGRFSSWQVEEERVKAFLILKDNNWKNEIEQVEKHGYFNGQIGFILDFAGILSYYNKEKNCDWPISDNANYLDNFRKYAEIASQVFAENYDNRVNDKNCCFERAVLTKYNYIGLIPNARLNLSSTAKVANNVKRDFSWKRRLRAFDESTSDVLQTVKKVFDDSRFKLSNIQGSLEDICKDGAKSTWRNLLVSQPQLMLYPQQGFIGFLELPRHNIVLYGESRMNHYHVELYTYSIWRKYFNKDGEWRCELPVDYRPFDKGRYAGKKVNDEVSCVIVEGFVRKDVKYQLSISAFTDDHWELLRYDLIFKAEAHLEELSYEPSIVSALNNCGFTWSANSANSVDNINQHENEGFILSVNDDEKAISTLKKLCEQLRKL